MKSATAITLLLILIKGHLIAQAPTERTSAVQQALATVDKMFREFASQAHVPGVVWGIMLDGRLVHTGTTGLQNISENIPAGTQSVFRIASMTKSFTAMAVMKLRDEGKLQLDDRADKYIPEMKKLKYPTTDARPITIRDLLTHAAGFPEDNPWGDRQLAKSDNELMQLVSHQLSFSTTPGTAYEYSNLGFALLGRIISLVARQPYGDYITQHILRPLGMNNTYWEYTKVPASQLAHGYRWINNAWREEGLLHHGSWGAMGGLMTTMDDFAKYVAFHQSAWPAGSSVDNGPVKRSSLREMQHPWNFAGINGSYKYATGRSCATASAYGYGLRWLTDCDNRILIGHTGGLPGFGSNWQFMPDYGIAVISFANRTYASTASINMQVLDTVVALAKLKPISATPAAVLNERKNQLGKLLPEWNNAEASGIFAENFFSDYIIDSLRKDAREVFKKAGAIQSVGEFNAVNRLRGTFLMHGQNGNVEVWFTLTPQNPALIQEYRIRFLPK